MKKNNYKYKVGDVFERKFGTLKIKAQTRVNTGLKSKPETTCKAYDVVCLECGGEFTIREGNLDRNQGCPFCSGHRLVIGQNDMWTTVPHIAKMFTDPEDGYRYAKFSNKKASFTCPVCKNNLGMKAICDVSSRGLSCSYCGDGISYPNKFMYWLLKEVGADYQTEQGYEWCIFPDYNNKNKICHGLYDFLSESEKAIIEMDGGLGHGKASYANSKTTVAESIYRDKMKDRLAKEHGYSIIRIDCSYYDYDKRFEICRNAVLHSKLADIYDLSNIDWNRLDANCLKSFIVNAADMYNNGIKVATIASVLNKDKSTIYDYLKQATNAGLCNFKSRQKPKISFQQSPFLCIDNGFVFDNVTRIMEYAPSLLKIRVIPRSMQNTIHDRGVYKGYHWQQITRAQFNQIKRESPEKAFGDFFYEEKE